MNPDTLGQEVGAIVVSHLKYMEVQVAALRYQVDSLKQDLENAQCIKCQECSHYVVHDHTRTCARCGVTRYCQYCYYEKVQRKPNLSENIRKKIDCNNTLLLCDNCQVITCPECVETLDKNTGKCDYCARKK